jgi:hypothetical protein
MRLLTSLLVLSASAVALMIPPPAEAVECGVTNPLTNEPLRANLSLIPDRSDIKLPFRWRWESDYLVLLYKIEGCEIPQGAEVPTANVETLGKHINAGGIEEKPTPEFESERSRLRIRINANPQEFDPGKYRVIVTVSAPYLNEEVTEAEVSRFASMLWAFIAVAAGAVAAFFFLLTSTGSKAKRPTKVRVFWLLAAFVVSLGAGAWVIFTDYFSESIERWELPTDFGKTLLDAFLAASGAAVAAIVARVWTVRRKRRQDPATPKPTPPKKNAKDPESLAITLAFRDKDV